MTNDPSHPVIPLDAEAVQPGFDIVLRGYDRGQVDRQIGWLEEQLGVTDRELAALTEAVRRAEHDANVAREQEEQATAALERGRPTFQALGERIGSMLQLAEEEAEELRRTGGAELERARTEWGAELAAARRALEEEQRTAHEQAAATVAQARQEAQRIVTEARRSAAETTGAAQRQVEAMSRQRDAIHAELLRVRERFAAVLGGTIDVTGQRPDAADQTAEHVPEQAGPAAERTTGTPAAGAGSAGPTGQRGADAGAKTAAANDPATGRTQPMPAEPTAS